MASWSIGLAVFTYGIVFGILARQVHLGLADALAMGALVFAGASQFAVLGLWGPHLPVATIVFTALAVNLRHILMGAALQPWFSKLKSLQAYGSLFFMNDESWALTMQRFAKGSTNGAFLLGSGLVIYVAWLSSTFIGHAAIGEVADPASWGLDFALPAVFLSLLVGVWRGRSDLLPWIVAAAASLAFHQLLPGKWYLLLGALCGSGAAAIMAGGKRVQR